MNIQLFKALVALDVLKDKDSITIRIEKTDEEFTVMVGINKDGKKCHPVISGTADELDEGIMQEITKPIERINGLKSNADTAEIEDNDDEDDNKKLTPNAKKKVAESKANAKSKTDKSSKKDIEKAVISTNDPVINDAIEKEKAEIEETKPDPKKRLAEINAEIDAIGETRHIKIEALLKEASDLFPEDAKLLEAYNKKNKYINAMIVADIMPAREEWEKGETKWH